MRLRQLNLIVHRDLGFLVFGLTLVYAISGVAVNHLHQWNPNFVVDRHEQSVSFPKDLPAEDLTARILSLTGVEEKPRAAMATGEDEFKVFLDNRTLILRPSTGTLTDERVRRRPLFFDLNWLHTNRARGLWTWIADFYALSLLALATTGLFIVRGRKGIVGRGGVYVTVGVVVPLVAWLILR